MAKRLVGIVGIFLVGIALGFVINTFSPINLMSSDVSSKVENLYKLVNPGVDFSVVKLDNIDGMYKVLLKATDVSGATTYREAYVSKDGKLLSESMVQVEQSITQLTKMRDFVDCLTNKNVKIAGIANQTATLMQFNTLGGSYATKLYLSCDGELAQQCVDAGITQVPAVIYENKGYAGVQSVSWFENITGCKF